ncbi:MAG: helix-turn-helix transcriptional regulator [Anaerolineales bacterium]|jgi:DNA-binding PadR family transcriptional regulator
MSPSNPSLASSLSPEFVLLGLLAEKPAHGYELHRRLRTDLGQVWRIRLNHCYNLLKRLETQGLIEGEVESRGGAPDRRRFHLTRAGKARFESWMSSPAGTSVRAIRVEFLTKLYFLRSRSPKALEALVADQRQALASDLRRLQKILDQVEDGKPINRLALDLRISQLKAILGWLTTRSLVKLQQER